MDGFGLAADSYGIAYLSNKGLRKLAGEGSVTEYSAHAFHDDQNVFSAIQFVAELIPGFNVVSTAITVKRSCF